jgi:poly(3-hydroxybutyrate) depolymerase
MMKSLVYQILAVFLYITLSWAEGSGGTGGKPGEFKDLSFEGSVYYLFVPPQYEEFTPMPLLVHFHGGLGEMSYRQDAAFVWYPFWQKRKDFYFSHSFSLDQ